MFTDVRCPLRLPHSLPNLQAEIINQLNDFFNTDYDIEVKWTELFCEAPEQQEAMRLARLRSGSLPTSPRAMKGGLGGVGSLAAAVAAAMQQQQHWPAAGGAAAGGKGATRMQRKASATLQQLQADLADTDSDDDSYSEQESGESLAVAARCGVESSTMALLSWVLGSCTQPCGMQGDCPLCMCPAAGSSVEVPPQHWPPLY